jgi:hypothetical protein
MFNLLSPARDSAIERTDSDDRASHDADGLGLVVGQVELVRVGQCAELEEDVGGEEVGCREAIGPVMNGSDVEEVENGVGVLK